jgi:hypothetical protein
VLSVWTEFAEHASAVWRLMGQARAYGRTIFSAKLAIPSS